MRRIIRASFIKQPCLTTGSLVLKAPCRLIRRVAQCVHIPFSVEIARWYRGYGKASPAGKIEMRLSAATERALTIRCGFFRAAVEKCDHRHRRPPSPRATTRGNRSARCDASLATRFFTADAIGKFRHRVAEGISRGRFQDRGAVFHCQHGPGFTRAREPAMGPPWTSIARNCS
jgi:hypothetical protein